MIPPELLNPTTAVPPHTQFRLAQATDKRPLHHSCYPNHTTFQFDDLFNHLMRRQEQERCYWLIATHHQKIIGNGQLLIYGNSAECANLFIMPDYRGQGIGTALIQVLTAVAHHQQFTSLEIGVAEDNPRALALYQRLGFQEDRHLSLPGSKPAIILQKSIP